MDAEVVSKEDQNPWEEGDLWVVWDTRPKVVKNGNLDSRKTREWTLKSERSGDVGPKSMRR